MNVNFIINMVVRQLVRRAVNFGVGAGINAATKGRKKSRDPKDQQSAPPIPGSNPKRAAKQARLARRGPWT